MHRFLAGFIATALLAGFSTSLFAADKGVAAVEAAWVKAMKANDLDGVATLYASDAMTWFPDRPPAMGAAAIRAEYKEMLDPNTVKDVVLSDTHSKTSGNVSAGWGNFVLTLVPKAGGDPIVMKGRFTDVAEMRDGKWLYIADHASSDPAPPAAK
jgi:uncharacterized protein (TIGR02246 family)